MISALTARGTRKRRNRLPLPFYGIAGKDLRHAAAGLGLSGRLAAGCSLRKDGNSGFPAWITGAATDGVEHSNGIAVTLFLSEKAVGRSSWPGLERETARTAPVMPNAHLKAAEYGADRAEETVSAVRPAGAGPSEGHSSLPNSGRTDADNASPSMPDRKALLPRINPVRIRIHGLWAVFRMKRMTDDLPAVAA